MGPPNEPIVPITSRPPPGYRLVPKGNPYITLNCRKQTHASGQKVYQVVKGPKRSAVGIRVPSSIYDNVLAQFHATKEDRAAAVHKRDDKLEDKYHDAILKAFPRVQKDSLGRIVKHAMAKKSGRVGRTGTLGIEEKAVLGTMAHIRHVHTSYDTLMKSGVSKQKAREQTYTQIMKKAEEWGFKPKEREQPSRRRKGRGENKAKRRKKTRSAARRHDTGPARPGGAKDKSPVPIEISDDSDDEHGVQISLPARGKAGQDGQARQKAPEGSADRQRIRLSTASRPRGARRGFATTRSMAQARGQNVGGMYERNCRFFDDDSEKGSGSDLSDSDDVYWISSDDDTDDADGSYGEEV